MNWVALNDESLLEEINQRSFDPSVKGILIFKHSTRCATSSMALNRLERNWNLSADLFPNYFLDLIRYQSISAKIAQVYNVTHESPQVLVIKNGKCIYTVSHSGINFAELSELPV